MLRQELTVRATSSGGIQLQAFGGSSPLSLLGYGTVVLWTRDALGSVTSTDNLTGRLLVNGAAGGSVLWTPGSADLAADRSPYAVYLQVYVTPTSWFFVPEDYELPVTVRAAFQ